MPSLLDALIQTESNGNPSARGPMTKYGQALGSTQMLPATAQEMARKLGLPFRADLLTSPTDEGKAYQRQLGEAYLQEGFERTGNTRDALRYYHGGPNRQLWGPKTDAYADKVMSLSGDSMNGLMPTQPAPQNAQEAYQRIINGGPMSMQDGQPDVLNQGPLAGMMQMDPASLQGLPEAHAKPHAFDKGGKGWVIAGIIADAIAGGFGGRGGFAPTYLALQQDERDNQRRLAERQQVIDERRQERMHTPYRFQNNAGDVVEIDPSSGDQRILYADPNAKPDYAKIENPDGSIEMRPVQNQSRPTRQHIEALLANPDKAAEFDAHFGQPGLAEAILRGRR